MRRKTKRLLIEFSIVLSALVGLTAITIPKFFDAQNFNTPRNFPDPNFRALIETALRVKPGGHINKNQLSKIKTVNLTEFPAIHLWNEALIIGYVSIPPATKPIFTDLSGIELFSELEELNLNHSPIDRLTLSNFKNLKQIRVYQSNLRTIELSDNPSQETIVCVDNNAFKTLKLTRCPNVTRLECRGNALKVLDLSNCPKIQTLICESNKIESLDLSGCKNLTYLDSSKNALTKIDLSNNLSLMHLDISYNQISDMPNLIQHQQISSLNVKFNNFDENDIPNIHAIKNRIRERGIEIEGLRPFISPATK